MPREVARLRDDELRAAERLWGDVGVSHVSFRFVPRSLEGMPSKKSPSPPRRRRRRHPSARPTAGPTCFGDSATQWADERELRWFFGGTAGVSALAQRRAVVRRGRLEPALAAMAPLQRAALGVTWAAAHGSAIVAQLGGMEAFRQLLSVVQRRAVGAGSKALRLAAFATVRTLIVLEVRAALSAFRRATIALSLRRPRKPRFRASASLAATLTLVEPCHASSDHADS